METTKQIPDYENYSINTEGVVMNISKNKALTVRINDQGYAVVTICKDNKPKCVKIHRLLATLFIDNPNNLPCVDHIDRNRANHTLSNLRWVTRSTNQRNMTRHKDNKSGYMGVSWHIKDKKWRARIYIDGQSVHIGNFDDKIEAAKAFDKVAFENGFHHTNFTFDGNRFVD